MFNRVVLVGHLTRDVELRYTNSGTAIGNCGIGVNKRWTDNNGVKQEKACFIDIVFFGRQAETANQYLQKGSKVLIEGELDLQQWTDNNGQNRSKHAVLVSSMEMLGDNQQGQQTATYNQGSYTPRQTNNYQTQQNQAQYRNNNGYTISNSVNNANTGNNGTNLNQTQQQRTTSQNFDDGQYEIKDETIPF